MKNHLLVLWKTDSMIDVEELLIPYVFASKKNEWWDQVSVIIWGGSQRLVSENKAIQDKVIQMLDLGIQVHACKKCADDLCVADHLSQVGIDVLYTGEMLTEYLKSDAKVLTI
ncbi:MAG: DsrE family protein [Candidatus Izemoplasmatales bacterium]